MTQARRVLFLPGASGNGDFWRGVGGRLPTAWEKSYLSWPGLGDEAHDASVHGYDDLAERVLSRLDAPSDLVAQSMGGVIATRVAARVPALVDHLVLVATSGGVDVERLGGVDWRGDYGRAFPRAAGWVTARQPDQTDQLRRVRSPTLLLWGDADPISPVAVGEHLAGLIPGAELHVIAGGTHDVARENPAPIARLITAHLRRARRGVRYA